MSDLGPIDEDVRFDHGAADRLVSLATSGASTLEGQVGSRSSWVSTALEEFRGHFSMVFAANAETASRDTAEVIAGLRSIASQVGELSRAAEEEQARRVKAREWQEEQDNRSTLSKIGDEIGDHMPWGSEDKPPVDPMPPPPNLESLSANLGARQTPEPGSIGSGAGGTSSARPDDLRSFSSGSAGANDALSGKPGSIDNAYGAFVAGCGWGTLDASSVVRGFSTLVEANDQDVTWANAVASAFTAAGGDGQVSTLSNSAIAQALARAGVSSTRADIDIDPPIAQGNPPTSGYADDPVNAATGNFIENETDLGFGGGTATLALTRTYNSFDEGGGAFGPGWSSWTEAGLAFTDESARLRMPDGRVVVFGRDGGGWQRATGESLWLAREGSGLVVTDNAGSRWTFDRTGRLLERSRGAGTAVRLVHKQVGDDGDAGDTGDHGDAGDTRRLVRLEHERGRSISLTWSDTAAGPRVVAAVASDGRVATYVYDEGRLTGVTTTLGTRTYAWGEDGHGAGLVVAVVDADGVVEAENVYDERRRVVLQRSPHGRASRFVYLPGRVTVVSDEDGTRSNTWISDSRGRVVGIVDADERRQSTSYDVRGNPVLLTSRDGSTTVHEHDDRGRRVRTVTPSGADLTYGYDDLDRVTTVVTESGAVTEHAYASDDPGDRSPSVVVDPEGGRTELTWVDGLMTRLVDPTGVTLSFGHDEHGDLVSTTDALGRTARLERDAAGRVRSAVTPGGHRTTFTYAHSGLLASRQDPDGAVWRYEHSAAGRLVATTDPTGARTEIERGTDGEEARTIDPLGRAMTRVLDDLGNVSAAELPDGSRWEFVYDALSRLVATVDPSGGRWSNEYDRAGALTATVDPTGVRRAVHADAAAGTVSVDDGVASLSTSFDPLGRVVRSEQPDGSAAMAVHDRCGRPVELLDAEGGLTRIERDAAGRVVAVTSPSGAVSRREHDVCGRLSAVVDPTGARTTVEYDVEGRVAAQVLPTGERAWVERDAVGRVLARFTPGSGVARYAYDAAGRVRESSDTWHGRRVFRYDAAGQLVEVVNGNGGVTRWDYDVNGRAVAVTDPLGQVTRREFDAMNHCVAETDPLGRTTRAGYDAAGRQVWQTDPDGRRTEWVFDAHGRLASTAVDGRTVSSLTRDVRSRRLTLVDRTREDGATVRHDFEWDRRGRMVSRTRDGRGVSWTYDADGARATMTAPDGLRTSYERDAAGRLVAVAHPLLGRATLTRDAAGRVVSAAAGSTLQTWEHVDGFVVGHTTTDSSGVSATRIGRDEWGRVTSVRRDGETTTYEHDGAHQLIGARSDRGDGETVERRWRYDAAGRLVAESVDGTHSELVYDAAGQLLSRTGADGEVRYSYDGAGRRVRAAESSGRVLELSWSGTGYLSSVTEQAADGTTRRTSTQVDAHGELAEVDGAEVFWDSADGYAPGLVSAGDTSVVGAGPFTGVGSAGSDADAAWSAAGWRDARATGSADAAGDPWGVTPTDGLPGGLSIGASGELALPGWTGQTGADGGLEWLGARVYDSTTRGFLSVDSLDPVVGSGWAGNPYSYAGNDPVHALDPTGLKPLTDAELDAYIASTQGPLNQAFNSALDWAKDNWEYVAAGAMIVAGAALMIAPVPGLAQAAGMGLISAGLDAGIQKATTGDVNWGQVAVSGAAGMLGAGAGGLAARAGMSAGKVALTEGVVEGTLSGGGSYLTGPGPHTPAGLLGHSAMGAGTGALPGPALGDDAARTATRNLDDVSPTPSFPDAPRSPSFIVKPNGETVIVPKGAEGPHPVDTGKGFMYTGGSGGHGLADSASNVRIMDPVTDGRYPKPYGYVSYSNSGRQTIDPFSGQTLGKSDPMWHWEFGS